MNDYSQAGEQRHILAAFGFDTGWKNAADDSPMMFETKDALSNGVYLDIGAWNAKTFSNTRALYELGWSGVMIEPAPAPMLGLLAEYGNDPRITLIQACVTTEHGMVLMHVTDDAVSTSKESEYQLWKDTAKFHGSMLVPSITLEQIANQFGGFSFVNIDAEGNSAELFLQMLRLGHLPKCICVENDGRLDEIAAQATAKGYSMTFNNSTNSVWVSVGR